MNFAEYDVLSKTGNHSTDVILIAYAKTITELNDLKLIKQTSDRFNGIAEQLLGDYAKELTNLKEKMLGSMDTVNEDALASFSRLTEEKLKVFSNIDKNTGLNDDLIEEPINQKNKVIEDLKLLLENKGIYIKDRQCVLVFHTKNAKNIFKDNDGYFSSELLFDEVNKTLSADGMDIKAKDYIERSWFESESKIKSPGLIHIPFNFPESKTAEFEKMLVLLVKRLEELKAEHGEKNELFEITGEVIDFYDHLDEGKTLDDVLKENDGVELFSTISPHFKMEGSTPFSNKYIGWYGASFGGNCGVSKGRRGYKEMSNITAKAFVEENIHFRIAVNAVINKVKDSHSIKEDDVTFSK